MIDLIHSSLFLAILMQFMIFLRTCFFLMIVVHQESFKDKFDDLADSAVVVNLLVSVGL